MVPQIEAWPVLARRELTPDWIIESSAAEPGSEQALRVLALHDTLRERAILYAHQHELLASFLTRDPDTEGCIDSADITAVKVAVGLRVSTHRAECLVRDAHRAVRLMPATFTVLLAGDLPEEFHQHLLRKVRALTEEQTRVVDEHVASWDLASISRDQFGRHLNTLVAMVTAGTVPTPPRMQRRIDLDVHGPAAGLATLSVTGPILEIKDLAHRLDTCAHTLQAAQRHALDHGDEEIPFDLDGTLHTLGRPLSLAALRYAVLTHSLLDMDPVPAPKTSYTLLVTVPALTLLGASNAPGMLEGMIPVPADQARALAAGQAVWQRILTDPTTGAYLPVAAETYTPTKQMRLQLRLRHPVCAAPGCTRPTVLAAEDDHIEEYHHAQPALGGPTTLDNLHRLCWLHHQIKTDGHIDPERPTTTSDDPETTPPPLGLIPEHHPTVFPPLETQWVIDAEIRARTREDTDLLTPFLARALDHAWTTHLRAHDDALRTATTEAARPRHDRIIEQRQQIHTRRPRTRRHPKYPDPTPDHYNNPPPF